MLEITLKHSILIYDKNKEAFVEKIFLLRKFKKTNNETSRICHTPLQRILEQLRTKRQFNFVYFLCIIFFMHPIPSLYSTLNSHNLLEYIASYYPISINSKIIFLKRGFNDTYLIEQENNQKAVLRVYKQGWKTTEEVETEITLLNNLKRNNTCIAAPIEDKNGKYIHIISAPEGNRQLVIFEYANGERIRKINAEQAYLLGKTTGTMHMLTHNQTFGPPPFNYTFKEQSESTLTVMNSLLQEYPKQLELLKNLYVDFLTFSEQADNSEISYGICHGDLQAENFHIDKNNHITLFDFDFLGYGPLIYDLGVFMWYDHKNKTNDVIRSFLNGYKSKRSLTATELSLIPYVSSLRALFQMTLYCKISNGKNLPLWPTLEAAKFIEKTIKWHQEQVNKIKWL